VKLVCPTTGKQVIGSLERALVIAARIERQLPGLSYRPYRCKFCGWWHLTKQPSRRAA
jgi:predicted Zn-ribbon and HTH transcriptional regulator